MSLSAFVFLLETFFHSLLLIKMIAEKEEWRLEVEEKKSLVGKNNFCNAIVAHIIIQHSHAFFPLIHIYSPPLIPSLGMRFRIIIINMKASLRYKHNTHSSLLHHLKKIYNRKHVEGENMKKKLRQTELFFHFKVTCNGKKISQNSLLLLKLYKFLALCFATQPLGFLHIENTQ